MISTDLKEVTGKNVKQWFDELQDEEEGCASIWCATSDRQSFFFVMGWHDLKDLPQSEGTSHWVVAWKIGVQSVNSVMRTDFDIDFHDPKNDESGEVEDTTEILDSHRVNRGGKQDWSVPIGYRSWDELARKIRREAKRVVRLWA